MSTMNIYDLTDTWNAAGTTFAAIKMNVTDTASAAGSLLFDLQRNTTTAFSVAKTGVVKIVETASSRDLQIQASTTGAFHRLFSSTTSAGFSFENNAVVLGTLSAVTGLGIGNNGDLFLNRDAANTLAQRNGVNAQAFRLYNTFTDASNYERGEVSWASNFFKIATTAAGTGTRREMVLSGTTIYFNTGLAEVTRWQINGSGHFLAAADNAYDIGASGANRPRNVYVAGQLIVPNVLTPSAGFIQFGADGRFTHSGTDGVFRLQNNAGSGATLQFGGFSSSFPALKRNGTAINVRLADDSAFTNIQGKLTTETAYTAGAPTATGYIVLYDSTGTAYKIPAEAL